MHQSNYEKFPVVAVSSSDADCVRGWPEIIAEINRSLAALPEQRRKIVLVECYSGIHENKIADALKTGMRADHFLYSSTVFKTPNEIDDIVAPHLGGDDPIFGRLAHLDIREFIDPAKQDAFKREIDGLSGTVVVFGTAAVLCCEPDILIYADMPRWEGQLRQRRDEVSNLGVENRSLKASLQYKRSYFVDWRVLDRLKRETMARWDYLLDTTDSDDPKMVNGDALRAGLDSVSRRPFRVAPFFDPAPWGGQWMKSVCGLDEVVANYGWCFDCVPEENSLFLRFGEHRVEIPSLDLLYHRPEELLGDAVYGLFGAEFPIRFDFLDTIGGGNLSLQVHPLIEYIRDKFGLFYTQDESYYILDASPGATVYLGMKTGADAHQMFADLEMAQTGQSDFDADKFVNQWPAKKHDHFLIPAGTIHCSGSETMVLEISATPYIFTFKLWDWNRLGLDGLPRPINLTHGRKNLQADRDTGWTEQNLINHFEPLGEGPGWREERTGLHALEFIETRRHWFTGTVEHDTKGTVNVLNLVEGREAVVESPTQAFEPFAVHFAETFIVPASVGKYTIRPNGESLGCECATMKAFVRLTKS